MGLTSGGNFRVEHVTREDPIAVPNAAIRGLAINIFTECRVEDPTNGQFGFCSDKK